MACRLIEGWESSTTPGHYAGKWTTLTNVAISAPAGRNGQGLRWSAGAGGVVRLFDAQATWVVGFAFRTSALGALPLADLTDTAAATVQDQLALNADGTLTHRRGTATALGTTVATLAANTWYYLEWKVTIGSGTAGAVELRINGITRLSLPGVNTQQSANASASQVRLGATGAAPPGNADYDDVYLFDGAGSANTDFAGDCKVEQLLPSGAGATTAWTPSAGSNFACVDDAPPNSDTDYVSSATAGQTDTYAFGNLTTTSGTVKAVQATAFHRKDDAGSRTLALVARPGGTDRVGASQAVSDSYTASAEVWNTNPDTAAAWTIAEVNAGEFGVRLVA